LPPPPILPPPHFSGMFPPSRSRISGVSPLCARFRRFTYARPLPVFLLRPILPHRTEVSRCTSAAPLPVSSDFSLLPVAVVMQPDLRSSPHHMLHRQDDTQR
jgi:hypothetical protein